MKVALHPAAVAEAQAARLWYDARSPAMAAGFMEELDLAVALIAEAPERWVEFEHGTRRYLMRRYPYSVVYCVRGDVVTVIAVAHHRRRPGYWKRRTRTGRSRT